jgi:peptidoglycan hydrolase-like protein with peptidoglycan-binding domain
VRHPASLLAAFCAALLLAPTAGAVNPQIAGLQIALRERGLYRGAVDGVQGPRTRRAVLTFQRKRGLAVDGLAGPQTRAALGRLGRPLFGTRVIRRGMTGYDVAVLQFLLARHGVPAGSLDGRFGAGTLRAVRRFQRKARLTPDGVVGRRTARRLCGHASCSWRATRAPVKRPPPARVHKISPGETLTTISRKYGVSVRAIARANRVDPQRYILAGARLRIPGVSARIAMTESFSVRAVIDYWSRHYGVEPRLARALAWWESGYNNSLVSSAGARGVMQVTPQTWSYVETILLRTQIPHTANGNVRVGVAYLAQLLREFRGDVRRALAAYVQGPASFRTRGMLRETRLYVEGVLAVRQRI